MTTTFGYVGAFCAGVPLALVAALLIRGSDRRRLLLAGVLLVLAAAAYVVPFPNGDAPPAASWAVLACFAAMAALGVARSAWFLAAGWAAHALWAIVAGFAGVDPLDGYYASFSTTFGLAFALVVLLRHAVTPEPGPSRPQG